MAVYTAYISWKLSQDEIDHWREDECNMLLSDMQWTEPLYRHRASRCKALAAESSAIALHDADSSPHSFKTEFRHSRGHLWYVLKYC
jgi:hypothetical protein